MIQAFRTGRLGLWALDDMGLLFRGNDNMAALPGPEDLHVASLPLLPPPSAEQPQDIQWRAALAPPEVDESMALISSFSSSVPSIIQPNSPTSNQISTFVSSFFQAQALSLSELSTSKNQIKKRELQAKNEARKLKWRAKHPNLIKTTSKLAKGIGLAKGAKRPFYIGGSKARIKIEKARILARRLDRKRKKRAKWT